MHGGFGVKPGSSARDAEQRARESERTPFRGNVGINVSRAVGQKFELEARPSGPGEALPAKPVASEPAPAPAPAPQPEVKSAVVETPPSAAGRVWNKFRGLFSRK